MTTTEEPYCDTCNTITSEAGGVYSTVTSFAEGAFSTVTSGVVSVATEAASGIVQVINTAPVSSPVGWSVVFGFGIGAALWQFI